LLVIATSWHYLTLEVITEIDRPRRKDQGQLEMSCDSSVQFYSAPEDIPPLSEEETDEAELATPRTHLIKRGW